MISYWVIAALGCAPIADASIIRVINHHDFTVRMPWTLREGSTILIDVPAQDQQVIDSSKPPLLNKKDDISARLAGGGLHLMRGERDLGTLNWDIVVQKLDHKISDDQAAGNRRDFPALFKPLALHAAAPQETSLGRTLHLQGSRNGVALHLDVDVYATGFVDLRATVVNQSAPRRNVYCAVVTQWRRPECTRCTVDYDNCAADFDDGASTPFRAGDGKYLFIQRGVDWINTQMADGSSLAWLNAFASSLTVHEDATAHHAARWIGGDGPQLGQEAVLRDNCLYSITEIAHPMIRAYASRFQSNVLPGPDQPLTFSSRLVISHEPLGDQRVDQLFVAWTGFNDESTEPTKAASAPAGAVRLTLGVPWVKFGTAYFPYSTFGENFEAWHMPGQSQQTYWPLSADSVTHYKLFAEEIERDLRIIKAMGFDSIRLHHLELIASLPQKVQDEYLDFIFAQLKHVGLTATLDVKLPPARIAELVKRYRPQIDGVELDNEVLIFGIEDQEVPWFKAAYSAVKSAAPEIPVWLTAHTNTGAFDRLRKLGVPFDRVGQHAYMDSLDAIPSGRDYALAMANCASRIGKSPIITEWNWRFLTRMSDEARAKIYRPIFENVLKTRCMPQMDEFQFQESLAMASHTLRGIRHYELLNLSRRPKPEALELMKLIQQYGNSATHGVLKVLRQVIDISTLRLRHWTILVSVSNISNRPQSITATAEGPAALHCALTGGEQMFILEPGATATRQIEVQFPPDAPPGFYHTFVRFETQDHLITYAWIAFRKAGALKIDKTGGVHPEIKYAAGALAFDFNRPLTVVYGTKATGWEFESAHLIQQTLESATGRVVEIEQLDELPAETRSRGHLIIVGTPADNPLIPASNQQGWVQRRPADDRYGDTLIVAGRDESSVSLAATDLVLRYWKFAKDAGMRRIPLTDKPIGLIEADPRGHP